MPDAMLLPCNAQTEMVVQPAACTAQGICTTSFRLLPSRDR